MQQHADADKDGSEDQQAPIVVGLALIAHDQSAVIVHPGVETFDLIALCAGRVEFGFRAASAAVLILSLGDGGTDTLGSESAA